MEFLQFICAHTFANNVCEWVGGMLTYETNCLCCANMNSPYEKQNYPELWIYKKCRLLSNVAFVLNYIYPFRIAKEVLFTLLVNLESPKIKWFQHLISLCCSLQLGSFLNEQKSHQYFFGFKNKNAYN